MNSKALTFGLLCAVPLAGGARVQQSALDRMLSEELPNLVATYKRLHAAPELSHHEEETSAFIASQLHSYGYTVTQHVGKYQNPAWTGHGVVAVMKNGTGPTVLVRAELDALPIAEETGLPYASKVKTKDDSGREVGVMHACGHDVHMTSLLGTAHLLAQMRGDWHGTLVFIGQPSEETIDGARAMLADGLYTRFPRPDYALALHDAPDLAAGKVGYTPGYALASSTTVDIMVRGVGGHGSAPEHTKDPIVTAAQLVLVLQTIVSREISPFDPAVVTVGMIQGGTKANIIPDEVHLALTVRTYKEEVRQKILASIARITRGTAEAAGIPADRAPIVKVSESEQVPATYNDPRLAERLAKVFTKVLGAENVVRRPPVMASEDFGLLGLGGKIPICTFTLGAVDEEKIAQSHRTGAPLPGLHSSKFAPLPEPTIRTGVKAMTSAVLDLMR